MTTRHEYIEQLKAKLDEWDSGLGKLEEKARVARNDVRIDYEMRLESLRKYRAEAELKLKELQGSSEEAWKSLSEGADAAWSTMRDALEKAASHFKK